MSFSLSAHAPDIPLLLVLSRRRRLVHLLAGSRASTFLPAIPLLRTLPSVYTREPWLFCPRPVRYLWCLYGEILAEESRIGHNLGPSVRVTVQ